VNTLINPALIDALLERIRTDQLAAGTSREEIKHLRYMENEKMIEPSRTAKCGWKVVKKSSTSSAMALDETNLGAR